LEKGDWTKAKQKAAGEGTTTSSVKERPADGQKRRARSLCINIQERHLLVHRHLARSLEVKVSIGTGLPGLHLGFAMVISSAPTSQRYPSLLPEVFERSPEAPNLLDNYHDTDIQGDSARTKKEK